MPVFTNRVESNAEEGEERPEKRDDDPASEEIAGEFTGSAVETVMLRQYITRQECKRSNIRQRPDNEQC